MLNAALREKNRDAVKPWRHYIWLLMNGLRELPPIAPHTTVYRCMSLGMSELGAAYAKDSEFQWVAFSSTTSRIGATEGFLGTTGPRVMFHLKLTENVARDISAFSFHDENEILLPPNMTFEVKSSVYAGHGLHILQCDQTPTIDMLLDFPP